MGTKSSYIIGFNTKEKNYKRVYLCDMEKFGWHTTGRLKFAKRFSSIELAEDFIRDHMAFVRNAEKEMILFPDFEIVDTRLEKGEFYHTMNPIYYKYLNKTRNSLIVAFGSLEKVHEKFEKESFGFAKDMIDKAYSTIQDELDLVERKFVIRYIRLQNEKTKYKNYSYTNFRRILGGWKCYGERDRFLADRFTKIEAKNIIESIQNGNKEIKCIIPKEKTKSMIPIAIDF